MKKKLVLISVITAVLFTGCGGGGSSSTSNIKTQVLSGIVSDPEIQDAQVQLCQKNDLSSCLNASTNTDENGKYTLTINGEIDLDDYFIIASNGVDTKTGTDFTGFSFKAPTNLPKDENNDLIISPLTTLIANEVSDGNSIDEALNLVSENIGLTKDELIVNPSSNKEVQEKAIILSSIRSVTNKSLSEVQIEKGDVSSYIESLSDEAQKNQLKAILELLKEENTLDEMLKTIVSFQELLNTDEIALYDKTNTNVFKNINKAAKKIVETLKSDEELNISKIRKLVSTIDKDDYTNENKVIEDIDTDSLDLDDSSITIVDVQDELSENISETADLRDYYYSSNISHINKAEEIVKDIVDISTTDTIYLGIANAFIANNDLAKAKYYLYNKIFKTTTKNSLKIKLAKKLIEQNTQESKEEAKTFYDEVFEITKKIYENKEIDSLGIINLSSLLEGYGKLNENTLTENVTNYLSEKKEELSSLRKILNALKKVTNSQIEEGIDKAEIEKLIDLRFKWASEIAPANGKLYVRMVYISQCADSYIEIESYEKAEEVANVLLSTAKQSPEKTKDNYTIKAVEYFIKAGNYDKAQEVMDLITSYSQKVKGYQNYAIAVYKKNGIDEAIEFINQKDDDEEYVLDGLARRNTLTYLGSNKSKKYLASIAIDENNFDDAKKAVDEAVRILDEEIIKTPIDNEKYPGLNYVSYGYAKYAQFYYQLGETQLMQEMFEKAEKFYADNVSEKNTRSLADLINAYVFTQNTNKAEDIFNLAMSLISDELTIYDRVYRYSNVIYLSKYQEKEIVLPYIEAVFELLSKNEDISYIKNEGKNTEDSGIEVQKEKRIEYFIKLASFFNRYSLNDEILSSLNFALSIANNLANTESKYENLSELVKEYTKYAFVKEAINLANSFIYTYEKRKALASIANSLKNYDAFPDVEGASVDNDGDGVLDFYDYGYDSTSVTLPLDDDLDNDGILNADDATPYYNAEQ